MARLVLDEPKSRLVLDEPEQESKPTLVLDEEKPKKSFKQFMLEPISKQLTGKSIGERTDFLNKSAKSLTKKAVEEGKTPSTAEFFIKQLPAATGQALTHLIDVSPLDIGIMAATGGAGKIPFKGTTVGEIAKTIPVGKGFVKGAEELGKYKQALKNLPKRVAISQEPFKPIKTQPEPIPQLKPSPTPDVSEPLTAAEAVKKGMGMARATVSSAKFAENINLTKYPEDVRKIVSDLISKKPELGKTPRISDDELIRRAGELKDTPTVKYLASLPEGTVESEALKIRQGNTEAIRQSLSGELTNLKNNLDIIQSGIGLHRKTASMFGRGLRQQKLPAEEQQKMAFAIDDTLKKIKKDPIFSKDDDLIEAVKNLRKVVVDKQFNPTLLNKVYFAWMNSILSNPFTHITNVASNTFFAMSKIPEKFASAVWDLPLSLKTGKRTQFFGEIPAMIKGALSKKPLPQELAIGSKLDIPTSPIRGKVGEVIGIPTKLLQVEDNLAKNVVGKMEWYAQRYAGKTGEALKESVNKEQLYRTFQSDMGVIGNSFMTLRDNIPLLRYVIPFIKTPENIIIRGLERTPLVGFKIIKKSLSKQYNQEELSKDLGNLTLGTIGTGWIGLQWAKGNITGNVPSGAAERDAFYRQGKKPNAIKIGGNWISFSRLEPLGTSMATMVNLIEDYKNSDKENIPEKSLEAFSKLGKTLTNKSYLSGFTSMVNSLSDPERYGQGFIGRIVTGAEPQLLKFFTDLKDPYYREANSILEQLKAKTPGLSETLPPKLNAFGEPIKKDFLNIGKVNKDPVEKLLQDTPIGFPSKSIGKEKLKTEEYQYILKESGKQIKKTLSNLSVDDFLKLPVELREQIISDMVSKIRKPYRGEVRVKKEFEKLKKENQ